MPTSPNGDCCPPSNIVFLLIYTIGSLEPREYPQLTLR